MRRFLYEVARDLYNKCGGQENGLAHVTVVFPNKRARLFFDDSLAEYCGKPVWSPSYTTIEELFLSHSTLQLADHIELITMLYGVYTDVTHSTESIDSFWCWGEQMLSDFNDIDRNLANSEQLFSLLKEQKELTDTSFLTDKQRDALNQFFHGFDKSHETGIMQSYKSIWSTLGTIYSRFNALLESKGCGYDGMIQRMVIANLNIDTFTSHRYVFVGFNSLNKAEQELFRALKSVNKAMFYWDYDARHTANSTIHEAGRFMRQNITEFPNQLPEELFAHLKQPELTIVKTSTNNAQARYITQWLQRVSPEEKAGKEIAIVLADESLLHPVLHSIPPHKAESVNITMGYRLSDTPLYGFVMSLIEMQRQAAQFGGRINMASFRRILTNPITSLLSSDAPQLLAQMNSAHRMFPDLSEYQIDDKLFNLFKICSNNIELLEYLLSTLETIVPSCSEQQESTLFQPLMQESIYRVYTHVNRLYSMVESGSLNIQPLTLCRLIRSSLSSATVPFHGEPAVGMQVMGMLETRNLDFKHLLLLSAQEGCLPKSSLSPSFIPYNIRIAFGLTTMEDKSAIESYNFYHLLERAESVTMVYNGNADAPGIGKGQMSRYLLQLSVDNNNIRHLSLETEQSQTVDMRLSVNKTPGVMEQICNKYNADLSSSYLSPTALNNYIDCPLKFYLAQVNGLHKRDENETEIDAATFGTLFHKSAELTYNHLASLTNNRTITVGSISKLLKESKQLDGFVTQAFTEELFNGKSVDKKDYSGAQMVNHDVIYKYLRQLLRLDKDCYAPFIYEESESKAFEYYMEIDNPLQSGTTMRLRLKGIIDRMDSKDGITRIVDYKTGKKKDYPESVSSMFGIDVKKRNYQAFQIMYYAYIVSHNKRYCNKNIAPVLLYTRSTSTPTKDDIYYNIGKSQITNFKRQIQDEFEPLLQEVIAEIFDPQKPLAPTQNTENCKYCDFNSLCARE